MERTMMWRRFVVWSIIVIVLVSILSTPAIASASTSISIFKKARSAYETGNFTGALLFLKQAIISDHRNVSIITDIDSALSSLGNYSGATMKALSIDPHHVGAFVGLVYQFCV
jgi:hypothetical protein